MAQRGSSEGRTDSPLGHVLAKEFAILVLTRKEGEVITIGENGLIRVSVVTISGDKVRIGIDAPPEVAVHREEIFNAIKRDKEHGK